MAAALLDQGVVAGLGNVYRAELLFLVRQHPFTPAADVASGVVAELWRAARDQLRLGVRLNRIVTIEAADRFGAPAGRIGQEDRLYVYHRAGMPCRRCGTPIASAPCGGRNVWWCPRCQPA